MALEEKSIGAVFQNRAEKFGDRVFMKSKGKGGYRDISWNQVYRQVMGIARGLLSLGVQPGERVAMLAENRAEWAFCDLGILSIGAADAPIYATNTPEQCAYIIKDCGARILIISNGGQLGKILAMRKELDKIEKVIVMDDWAAYPYPEWVMGLKQLIKKGMEFKDNNYVKELTAKVEKDSLATLIYTSGTTGQPKGVMLTHNNFISNCVDIANFGFLDDKDTFLSFLPLSHSLERTAGYYVPMFVGATIAYAESMDTLLFNLSEVHPTVMVSVPRFYEKVYSTVKAGVEASPPARQKIFHWALGVGGEVSKLLMNKKSIPPLLGVKYKIATKLVFSKLQERMGGKLKFFVSGGAPLAKEIAEFFHSAGILILEGYGLSETSPILTCNTPGFFRFGTVGKTIPSVTLKFSESDNEILAKGPNVMQGYFNMPEETKAAIDSDGWFHTGDVGEFDSDGFLRITDRLKDLIKTSGGKYVAPQHIEGILIQDKFIEQASVIGDRRKYCTVLVVPSFDLLEKWAAEKGITYKDRKELIANPDVVKLLRQSIDNVNKQLPSYESLKDCRILPEEFSQENNMLTPTMKVKRKIVNKTYADLIESMYPKE